MLLRWNKWHLINFALSVSLMLSPSAATGVGYLLLLPRFCLVKYHPILAKQIGQQNFQSSTLLPTCFNWLPPSLLDCVRSLVHQSRTFILKPS